MKTLRNLIGMFAGLATAVAITLAPASVSAAGNTFNVSPASGSYTTGSTFTVTISETSATDIDSARAVLTYNASALEVTNYSTAGNPFTTCVTAAGASAGKIDTGNCTVLGAKKSGYQPLAAVTFKVLASSGTGAVSFAGGTQMVSNGIDQAWTAGNGSYTFSAPVTGGKGGDTPAPTTTNPGTTTTKTAPTTKTSTPQNTVATANGTPAVESATTSATDDTTKDDSKAAESTMNKDSKDDAKKNDDAKDTASNGSKAGWFWLLAVIAVAAGVITARKLLAPEDAAKAKEASKAAAVAAGATAVASDKKKKEIKKAAKPIAATGPALAKKTPAQKAAKNAKKRK